MTKNCLLVKKGDLEVRVQTLQIKFRIMYFLNINIMKLENIKGHPTATIRFSLNKFFLYYGIGQLFGGVKKKEKVSASS